MHYHDNDVTLVDEKGEGGERTRRAFPPKHTDGVKCAFFGSKGSV